MPFINTEPLKFDDLKIEENIKYYMIILDIIDEIGYGIFRHDILVSFTPDMIENPPKYSCFYLVHLNLGF